MSIDEISKALDGIETRIAVSIAMYHQGLAKAKDIIEEVHQRYIPQYTAALEREDAKEIAHWQAYFSALTTSALEIDKHLNEI